MMKAKRKGKVPAEIVTETLAKVHTLLSMEEED